MLTTFLAIITLTLGLLPFDVSGRSLQPVGNTDQLFQQVDTSQVQSADTLDLAASLDRLAQAIETYTLAQHPPVKEEISLRDAGGAVQNYGFRAFWAVIFVVLTYFLVRATIWVLERLSENSARQRLFYKRLVPIARIMLWALGIFLVIRVIFQVDGRSLMTAAAAIGVAVGFAAQDLLKNVFGGLVIISDRPFQVGDKISVGGTYGEVSSIGLRSTRLVTPDDNLVTVPNAQVVDGQVANANAGNLDCQVVTDLYLPGFVDEQKAKQIAYEAAATSRYVYRNKPIVVIVLDEFKETYLTHLKVKAYVLDTRFENLLRSDVTERSRKAFREAGLTESAIEGLQRGLRTEPPASALGNADA